MKVQFELWQLITLALTLLTILVGLGRLLLSQIERRFDERLGVLGADAQGWRETERSVLALRAELAERYVRREDYIRGQTVIEAKLDAISSELKNVQIQGAKREH
ncbi:hypothetical protein [Stenotrophomonas sp. MMGLT7]|uniref:hypothetical protein n=1 Tax=Stenotrophomonas sp. MMGLT7 TaxID=2901227 RepID=UPI001E3B0EEE|nr:hypothetical protein [Stenotrophomonas sp. MMGLT7]MCD7099105.1 hypothetical protein [Stenotrophomonas sp. MMGLT7]